LVTTHKYWRLIFEQDLITHTLRKRPKQRGDFAAYLIPSVPQCLFLLL
jgi:hypothetical protein